VGCVSEWVGEVLERPTVEGRSAFEREGDDVIGRERRCCDSDGEEEEDGDEDRRREGDWGHRRGVEVRGWRSEMARMR